MHSLHWLQIAQALSGFTNLPFPSTYMGTFATSGLSDISTVLDPWVSSAPGTLPSPPAPCPNTHQHQLLRVSFLASTLWQIHTSLLIIVPQVSNISGAWKPFFLQNSLNCAAWVSKVIWYSTSLSYRQGIQKQPQWFLGCNHTFLL